MLSNEQVEQFKREGYTIDPEYFPGREARAMRLEMERLEKAGLGRNALPPSSRQENILFRALDEASPLYRALPFNDGLLADLSRLIGDPVVLWLDQIVLKPPRVGAGNIWHEDNARFKVPEVGRGVGIWIALHESTLANGTLEIVPST